MKPPGADTGTRPRAPAQARRGRSFFVAIILLLWLWVALGFGPYYQAVATGVSQAHSLIHLHAAVYTGWMVLLLAQALLVYRRRLGLHRRLGVAGATYGAIVLVLGLVVAIAAPALSVVAGRDTLDEAAAFLLLPLGDMVLFGGFFLAAIACRDRPELHKRLMLLAAIVLVYPAVARFAHRAGHVVVLLTWLMPLALAMAHDFVTRRNISPVYTLGLVILVAAFSRVYMIDSPAWVGVGRRILLLALPGYVPP